MSEVSLNVAPSPELLKAAAAANPAVAPGKALPVAGEAAGAPNPFAALLSGVLQGAQPVAETPLSPASAGPLPDFELEPDTSAGATSLLALPGTAAPLPAAASITTTTAAPGLAGNPLPGSGNELPLPPGTMPTTTDGSAAPAARDAPAEPGTTSAAGRPRIFLGDLAQSRPVDPGAELPPAVAADGARTTVAAALAGRPLTMDADARAGSRSRTQALLNYPGTGSTLAAGAALPAAPPVMDGLNLRPGLADVVRTAGLPVAGTELLAGQLAAFAANNDSVSTPAGVSSATSSSPADAGSAALLGRLGSTGLPPLQPLGDAGAFAGGLADRLLSLGGPGAHSARLKLHPEHLGELDVEITMDDGTAQVWFGTTTSQARDAIEGSLPRLREMFAEQGIQLTRTQIDAGSGQPGNSAFGQERRMNGGAGAWNDVPAWQPGRPVPGATSASGTAAASPSRLLDVWA